jgi:hypothetical protein
MTEEKKKTTYCFECHCWKPKNNDRTAISGRCTDLKAKTIRLDFCDTDKIPKEKS